MAPRRLQRRHPSLALTPQGDFLWRDYACEHGREVFLDEIQFIAMDGAITDAEMELRVGELDAVIERATIGDLVDSDELKEVRVDPELWEIRLSIDGRPVRIYHAEPQSFRDLMVGLKAHFKWVDGEKPEIDKRQNMQISHAARRYRDGAPRDWSAPVDEPEEPCNATPPC